jgi:predicted tellurium resistance membrane protein TerC
MEWSVISSIVISLITLTFLEIVLSVDNLIFISVVTSRLPPAKQPFARRLGLLLALLMRLIFLASVLWLIGLTEPLFSIKNFAVSGRDIILIFGGLFLLYKGTLEIHSEFEDKTDKFGKKYSPQLGWVIVQIAFLDIIFSLDSVFTAIGMTQKFWVMAVAISIAIVLMIFASEPLNRIVTRLPTIKMLVLSFLLLIGTVLIADGFHFHVPREYIYFALIFSVVVESLNLLLVKKRQKIRRQ